MKLIVLTHFPAVDKTVEKNISSKIAFGKVGSIDPKTRAYNVSNNCYTIIPLYNPNIACYANATLQSLVNCSNFRNLFMLESENTVLAVTIKDYLLKHATNTIALRKFAGDEYVLTRQQDVPQFFQDLCDKSNILRSCFQFELIRHFQCSLCTNEHDCFPATENILSYIYHRCIMQPNIILYRNFQILIALMLWVNVRCTHNSCGAFSNHTY